LCATTGPDGSFNGGIMVYSQESGLDIHNNTFDGGGKDLARRWHVITLAAFAGHLTVFGVLLVCLRATGVPSSEVTWVEAMAAWGLVRLLTAVPITPGGVGIVELGLSSALVGFGAGNAEAVAAVLLYRVLTVVPTLVLGAALGLTWRRHRAPEPA
jgi:uncharacterized protein (TIRG00374 family)